MELRKFGKTSWKVSPLGFGCMRLPTLDRTPMSGKIDRTEATRMIRYAIDQGVNYLDTAYAYHGGKSEGFLRKVLEGGYGERIKVATKSPIWLIKKPADFDKYLDVQLKRLGKDQIDFYLFHGLNRGTWRDVVLRFRLLKKAEGALRDGRICALGFSFHDDYKTFKQIVDGCDDWSLCQIQYNYIDTENQAGTKGLKYAASKGLAVVVMEPLLGGRLANPPRAIRDIIRARGKRIAPADLALQWIWNQSEVSVVLSGMSTMHQVRGNIASANRSGVDSLRRDDLELIARLKKRYTGMIPIPCTKCGYCTPCPNGVNIPANFEEYNDAFIHDDLKTARHMYSRFYHKKSRAGWCKHCGKCEPKCPQKIPIGSYLESVHAVLGEGKPFQALKSP